MSDRSTITMVMVKYFSSLREWFNRLEPRDRKSLTILMGFLSMLFLWLFIWQPVEDARMNTQESYLLAHVALKWMHSHEEEAKSATYSYLKEDKPLLVVATDTAQTYQLKFSQAEPGDNNSLHIALENVSFNNVMRWLNAMETKHNIQTTKVAIEKQDAPGIVNVNVTFKSP